MLRRALRLGIRLGLLAGLAYAVVKVLDSRRRAEPEPAPLPIGDWPRLEPDPGLEGPRTSTAPQPDPEAPAPAAPPAAAATRAPAPTAWVEPTGDVCPTSHPVKAKLSSKIFHVPGGLSYDRTRPDRCYAGAAEAEADGLRPAKR